LSRRSYIRLPESLPASTIPYSSDIYDSIPHPHSSLPLPGSNSNIHPSSRPPLGEPPIQSLRWFLIVLNWLMAGISMFRVIRHLKDTRPEDMKTHGCIEFFEGITSEILWVNHRFSFFDL